MGSFNANDWMTTTGQALAWLLAMAVSAATTGSAR